MADLEDILKFAWACVGLIGIHLYEPYLYLIIDLILNAKQSLLIPIFQQLYEELIFANKHGNLCQLLTPAFKTLEPAWGPRSSREFPFEEDIVRSLEQYLEDADHALMQTYTSFKRWV